MEGLVNYSSEDEQDDNSYSKVALRERGSGASTSGRSSLVSGIEISSGPLKRRQERSRSVSHEKDALPPHRKGRDAGGERERYRSGNTSNEDKHKSERRSEKLRDGGGREKRDSKDARDARSYRDDNGHKHDYKKHEDKRYRDPKRDIKRDTKDYNRDDKRYNRNEDRKSAYTSNHNRERFSSSKPPRYDDRKQNDDRTNDDRRFNEDSRRSGGGVTFDDRKRDFNDRRSNNDDRKSDRRNNEDRRPHRSYNEDRSHTYRPNKHRSGSPLAVSRNNSNKYDRDDQYTKRDRKHHSRSKSSSRSRSVEKSNDQLSLNNSQRAGDVDHQKDSRPELQTSVTEKKNLPTARNFEALLSLNLSEAAASKQPINPTKPDINLALNSSNPSAAAVQLPSYYNPNVINPNKYVEQMQKRKLIWGAKKAEDSASKWGHAQFSQDQDGKVASKFMRLMGIKSGTGGAESSTSPNESEMKSPTSSTSPSNSIDVKSREAMFSTMEQQYEVARQVTHTMRGVGLGFGSQPRPY